MYLVKLHEDHSMNITYIHVFVKWLINLKKFINNWKAKNLCKTKTSNNIFFCTKYFDLLVSSFYFSEENNPCKIGPTMASSELFSETSWMPQVVITWARLVRVISLFTDSPSRTRPKSTSGSSIEISGPWQKYSYCYFHI